MEKLPDGGRAMRIGLALGIVGSMVMFAGDMLLYGDISHTEMTQAGILATMRTLSQQRVMAGGAVGPLATFLYCFGFYAVGNLVRPEHARMRGAILLLFCLGAVYGGAYHSHYPHMAFAPLADAAGTHSPAVSYVNLMGLLTFVPWVAASLLFSFAVLRGMTRCRRYLALFTPFSLSLLNLVVVHLPPPYLIVIAGGWNSILFTLFFSLCLVESQRQQA